MTLQAPFPWFGGKSRVAPVVWRRFGDVANYVEPFFGSGAVLLGRPGGHARRAETVNDLDGFIANFWRAVTADPEAVAAWADWPIIETDLHARHAHLVGLRPELLARLEGDPDFYDAKVAGWWVAGMCSWIGAGYCAGVGPWVVREGLLVDSRKAGPTGAGVTRPAPHDGKRGVNRTLLPRITEPGITRSAPCGRSAGQGINRRLLPHGGEAGQGIVAWFAALAERLRRVRVLNGDWSRAVGGSLTTRHGTTGVLLDPPYGAEVEQTRVYNHDSGTLAADVRAWALEAGKDPSFRIALCGYEGEGHEALLERGWSVHAYSTPGGYGGGRGTRGDANRFLERVWFSPGCLPAEEAGFFALLGPDAACVECGNDDPTEGHQLCLDCLEAGHPCPCPDCIAEAS